MKTGDNTTEMRRSQKTPSRRISNGKSKSPSMRKGFKICKIKVKLRRKQKNQ